MYDRYVYVTFLVSYFLIYLATLLLITNAERNSALLLLVLEYCTITINSAGGGTWDRLAEIWTSATLRVDRGHVWISFKAKVRPLVVCCCVVRVPSHCTPCDLSMARTDLRSI